MTLPPSAIIPLGDAQLNIVIVVDVAKALETSSLENAVYIVDNSYQSEGAGTDHLRTNCRPGQALNWMTYTLQDAPYTARIESITFETEGACDFLGRYGILYDKSSPFDPRTDLPIESVAPSEGCEIYPNGCTPVYWYFAGLVGAKLPEGVYPYTLTLRLNESHSLSLSAPSINVIPAKHPTASPDKKSPSTTTAKPRSRTSKAAKEEN